MPTAPPVGGGVKIISQYGKLYDQLSLLIIELSAIIQVQFVHNYIWQGINNFQTQIPYHGIAVIYNQTWRNVLIEFFDVVDTF